MCIRDRLTQIRSEIREYQQAWEGKVNELQKKQDDIVRELREEANKKYEEIQETRENDRQEWMVAIHNTQTTVKKVHNKFDAHVKDANKKHEELKAEIHDTIRQKQQEQGETNNNMMQKLEEVDGRQRSTEQKLDETTKEKTTRIEELKGHLTKVRENQERLQRQLMEGECGISVSYTHLDVYKRQLR